jgi:hypothetical protein
MQLERVRAEVGWVGGEGAVAKEAAATSTSNAWAERATGAEARIEESIILVLARNSQGVALDALATILVYIYSRISQIAE